MKEKNMPSSFDREKLISKFYGIEDMMPEFIECFLHTIPKITLGIESAIQSKNYETLKLSAQTLIGLVSSFYASPSLILAQKLEEMGRIKRIENANDVLQELHFELTRLTKALVDLAHEEHLKK